MRILERISEHEMVAVFLKTEIASHRFATGILKLLAQDGRDRSVVDQPDTRSHEENRYRQSLLGELRGFGRNTSLFQDFPADVRWYRALARAGDLYDVRYVDYSYWNELSGGSRLAARAAERLRAGLQEVYGQTVTDYWQMSDALQLGASFPEMILVARDEAAPLYVLEGHVRLTAYLLRPELIPELLPVIIGYSPQMDSWSG